MEKLKMDPQDSSSGPADKRPYFVVTNEYPTHRKIRNRSDKAFRLHVTLLALCNQDMSDGIISKKDLNMLGAKAGKELLDAELVHEIAPGMYQMHDYLQHQKSRLQIEALVADKQAAGKLGGKRSAHNKWHVERGKVSPDCELCMAETG